MTDSEQPRDTDQHHETHADPASEAPNSDWSANSGTGPGPSGWGGSSGPGGTNPSAFLTQLQAMINQVATQSAPVAREIAAKAAVLAAVAAERAGPLAQRAAEVTQDVGTRVAVRSRDLAAELRRGYDEGAAGSTEAAAGHGGWPDDAATGGVPTEPDHGDDDDPGADTAPMGPTV